MNGSIITLFVGLLLGGFLAYWFEDSLRGPVMRAYDDRIYGDVVWLDNE